MKTQHLVYIAAVSLVAAAQIAFADTPANIIVEGRGLPQVQGVVRDSSKVEWGFANFIAFGPNWAYTAQDYAAKEHKKEPIDDPVLGRGLLFTAKIWAGSRGLSIRVSPARKRTNITFVVLVFLLCDVIFLTSIQ